MLSVKNEPLLYRFGFVCMPASELPSGEPWKELRSEWKPVQVGDLLVLAHPEVPVTPISDSGLLIGHAFAVGVNQSARERLETAFAAGTDSALHEALDVLSGRFALVTSQGRVYHDAIGSRAVFYHLTRPCIASHGGLIAGLFGTPVDPLAEAISREPEYASRSVKYLPGDLSVHDGVRALVPNNYYDIPSGRPVRYWPRAPRKETTLDQFHSCSDMYFGSFAGYLSGHFTPILSITAGIDSRAIIAAFRRYNLPMKYVTWMRVAMPRQDMPVVEEIGSYLEGDHAFLPEEGKEASETIRGIGALAAKNTGHFREPSSTTAYMHQAYERQRDPVFIRGNGGEIVRGFPAYYRRPIEEMSVTELVRAYNSSVRMKNSPSERYTKLASEAVEQFMVRANYEGLEGFGYHPNDLYYWEHRMGMWQSAMQNEMDAAMLSMLGFNNRRFFESAFGLEPGERLTEGLLLDLTRRYEEGLAKFPINPSKRPKPSGARRNTGAPPSNKQLQGKLKAQRRRNRALKERLEKRDSDLEQARRKHRKAVRERDHTQRERDRFRALYVEIRQSRWWRYTLPLRKIAGAVRSWASRRPGGPGA